MSSLTLFIPNLHCPSCVSHIEALLQPYIPSTLLTHPEISLLDRTVRLHFSASASQDDQEEIFNGLREQGGFDLETQSSASSASSTHSDILLSAGPATQGSSPFRAFFQRSPIGRLFRSSGGSGSGDVEADALDAQALSERHRRHLESCEACKAELEQQRATGVESGPSTPRSEKEKSEKVEVVVDDGEKVDDLVETTFAIEGMTCSACTSSIKSVLSPLPGIQSHSIDLLSALARVTHSSSVLPATTIKDEIEDAGYGAEILSSTPISAKSPTSSVTAVGGKSRAASPAEAKGKWKQITLSIEGMTCSACSSSITRAMHSAFGELKTEDGEAALKEVDIDPLKASGRVVVASGVVSEEQVKEEVEDAGYEVVGMDVVQLDDPVTGPSADHKDTSRRDQSNQEKGTRSVQIRVDGIFCSQCVTKLHAYLSSTPSILSYTPFTPTNHTTTLTYRPHEPLTIRDILKGLTDVAEEFDAELVKVRGAGDRGREIMRREREVLVWHFGLSLLVAVPTFIIAIVGMVILKSSNGFRMYWEDPVWGGANRGTVALWPLATVVQFGVGRLFYERAWRSLRPHLRSLLPAKRNRSKARRFHWNSLFSFGSMDLLVVLSTSVSYFASLAMLIMDVRNGAGSASIGTYFDSCVFLIMFILGGRVLEAFAKYRTTSAIAELGSLKPPKALLIEADSTQEVLDGESDLTSSDTRASNEKVPGEGSTSAQPREISADLLDIGDLVLLRPGDLPPADGVVHSGSTSFDESSLTGESRPVKKVEGDSILSGTTNLSSPIVMRITTLGQETMVEKIIRAVSEASGKKASIEKLAEKITGVFVPVIVYLAILVLVVWLAVTLSGAVSDELLGDSARSTGERVFFAFEFAISVLVVACPCGIGLAAPCAQAVGMGMAAKSGVLASGGGQAFQTATMITDVVFDKTGTLTEGAHTVSWSETSAGNAAQLGMDVATVEAAVAEIESRSTHPLAKAISSSLQSKANLAVNVVAAEEKAGRGVLASITTGPCSDEFLLYIGNYQLLKDQGYADVDEATLATAEEHSNTGCSIVYVAGRKRNSQGPPLLLGCWGISDRLRPESKDVIAAFQRMACETHMLTGDNMSAAKVVANELGIPTRNVVAGVLPEDKGAFIQSVQAGNRGVPLKDGKRRIVLFVGDGLNDSVALASADVAVALSHGSQATLASADFVLLHSSLSALLSTVEISRKVYRRQKLNFAWAVVFNCVCIPFAAGTFYDLHHIRLSPVWSAVAMALSSTSVVMSSLALRWGL